MIDDNISKPKNMRDAQQDDEAYAEKASRKKHQNP
jgi:hypothetical protein